MPLSSVCVDISKYIDLTAKLDYTKLDWKDLLSHLADMIPSTLPEWTDYSPSDMGMVLMQLACGGLDVMSYRVDLAMNERFLQTAVLRRSAIGLAKLIDYTPDPVISAQVELKISVDTTPITISKGTQFSTRGTTATLAIVFETKEDLYITSSPDVVDALEGITYSEILGSSVGTANQFFLLTKYPVAYDAIDENSLVLTVTESGVPSVWLEVPNILEYGPAANVYMVDINEEGRMSVIFGDDKNGKIPAEGTDNIFAEYRVGGGDRGNVAEDTIIENVTGGPHVTDVTNELAATGGADEESIASIKASAPRELRTLWRAVTAEDYKTLAEGLPGVQRAFADCITGMDPAPSPLTITPPYPSVGVYVVPLGGGYPTSGLLTQIRDYFRERQIICVESFALNPVYVSVVIALEVIVKADYKNEEVKTRVVDAVMDYFDVENTDFGYDIYLSDFLATLEVLEGVDHTDITYLYKEGGLPGYGNVVMGEKEVPIIGTLTVVAGGGVD